MKKVWQFILENLKAFFINIFTPKEDNAVMFYYGTLIYLIANIFVKDITAVIVVAVVVGVMLAQKKYIQKRKVTWLNFVFGMAATVFTIIQIWL